GGILRLLWQIAVERVDVDVGPDSIQQDFGAPNLAGTRQEDEYVADVIVQGSAHGAGGELLDACLGGMVEVVRVDRIAAALACYDRRIAKQPSDAFGLQRRRHHEYPKVFAKDAARLQRQCESEIRLEASLVEFVEDHEPNAVERRIILQQARQHPFGDHFDA